MLDLAITNGTVVDGTGGAARHADIGVMDGRVVTVGALDETAARTIDADGRVVAPGFVDVHTHFDAQAFWDPALSPSPLHGVTTVIAGNCGFSITPLSEEAGAYLVPMLARVEGMPLTSLHEGVPWDWKTTGEYLSRLEGTLAVNAGFMVGHSALRRVVLGAAANERAAEPAELEAMVRLLREGIGAGGLGFSTTTSDTHNDADGRPVPSRFADEREFVELARVCGEYEGTSLELLPRGATSPGPFDPDVAELMIRMSEVARRPLNWNVISPSAASLDTWLAKLAVGDQAQARGAKVVGLTMPVDMKARFSFHAGFVLDVFEGWAEILSLPIPERIEALRNPAVRARMADGAARTPDMGHLAAWDRLVIVEAFEAENKRFQGRQVGDIAAELGRSPFDALLDISVAEGLRTTFARSTREPSDDDWRAREQIWRDPRALIGASDAGAHLDMIAAFRYSTGLLEEAVRKRQLLSLEEAVRKLTGDPARLYGLRDRGVLREGAHADVVVFDPGEVEAGSVTTRFDLPGGAGRLYGEPSGIAQVIVGGAEIVAEGEYTGARPGTVLRSGRDTATPTLDL